MAKKRQVNVRLSDPIILLLRKIKEQHGVSQANAISLAVTQLVRPGSPFWIDCKDRDEKKSG